MLLTRPQPSSRGSGPRGSGPLSTRRGTLAVAGIFALFAAVALLLFLQKYREDLTNSDPVRVLVAGSLVPKGTPGEVVASERMYRTVKLRKSELEDGAITDPAELRRKVTADDVYPGHQLTAGDFEASSGTIRSRLSGFQRAMTVPVDSAHGMIGNIEPGDRADVIVTFGSAVGGTSVARVAARDVLVLAVPTDAKEGGIVATKQSATIRVGEDAAPAIAAAADGGKVWLVLRPAVGARSRSSTDKVAQALLESMRSGR